MKSKNLISVRTLLIMLVISSAMIFGSCKKDSADPIVINKTALTKVIASADSLSSVSTTADYDQADITAYKTTLASGKIAAAVTTLTQSQADNLVIQIKAAMALFNSKAFGFINEPLNLTAGWHFDEGTGTTATAYSTVKHVGTFKMGTTAWNVPGTTMPTWVAGVKGGKAIYLDKGAHLEVPFTPAFLPADLSISVWVKTVDAFADNYIVSQNYWEGYKFQVQDSKRPFFTFLKTDGNITDKDNGTSDVVTVGAWTHLVVTLNSATSTLTFYANGVGFPSYGAPAIGPLTRAPMHGADGALVAGNLAFLIGSAATDADVVANNWTWKSTQMSFRGAIDELKIFNIALTPGQVKKLYNDEKP